MSLEEEAEALLLWSEKHLQALSTAHVARIDVMADFLSRLQVDPANGPYAKRSSCRWRADGVHQ